jgi:hypothetical protein
VNTDLKVIAERLSTHGVAGGDAVAVSSGRVPEGAGGGVCRGAV